MDNLDANQIQSMISGTLFQSVYCFPEVNSTNTQLMLAARYGEPEGTVYVAERQTAGRGRFRRPWVAPAGKALLFSFLLYPAGPEDRLGLLPMMAALAGAEAVESVLAEEGAPKRAVIKWPNDVLIEGGKIGGVLAEMERVQGGRRSAVVVGMGLNVNQTADELPERSRFPATSLLAETGREVDRAALLAGVLARFSQIYQTYFPGDLDGLRAALTRRMATLGQPVALRENGARVEGTAMELSPNGGLIVRLTSGVEREIMATDVESLDWRG